MFPLQRLDQMDEKKNIKKIGFKKSIQVQFHLVN